MYTENDDLYPTAIFQKNVERNFKFNLNLI